MTQLKSILDLASFIGNFGPIVAEKVLSSNVSEQHKRSHQRLASTSTAPQSDRHQSRSWASLAGLGMMLGAFLACTSAQAAIIVANSGFESPVTGLSYSPSIGDQGGSGWEFHNYFAGIASNGSVFDTAPEGNQVGLIQQWDGMGSDLSGFSQTIGGFESGEYRVRFRAAGRDGYGTNPFVVAFDGNLLTFGGSTVVTPKEQIKGFQYFLSDPMALTAGSHTLSFTSSAATTEDHMSFIDAVSVSSNVVPEPSSFALLGLGGVGIAIRALYRRRAVSVS